MLALECIGSSVGRDTSTTQYCSSGCGTGTLAHLSCRLFVKLVFSRLLIVLFTLITAIVHLVTFPQLRDALSVVALELRVGIAFPLVAVCRIFVAVIRAISVTCHKKSLKSAQSKANHNYHHTARSWARIGRTFCT